MKYTHIIWDFNGTILDDVAVCIESVNTLLERRNLPVITSVENYRQVFGFPIIKYYEKIGFDFSVEDFGNIATEWVEEYMSRVRNACLNKGIVEMLEFVHSCNAKNVLVSATEINMLKKQLDMLGITDFFDEVYGLDNIHAQNKISLAESWKNDNPSAVVLLVGDTDHDYETAKAVNADCVLYSGGHQMYRSLLHFDVPVIDELIDLKSFLK